MANPNRKIVITEIDETRPLGAGVSSDVAYVPGLAVEELSRVEKADGSIEVTPTLRGYPVLCNTVADLEAAFGTEPYRFTEDDIDDIEGGTIARTLGIQEGDFDKSYIYAKELLQRGMSVYYENISADYKPEDEAVESAAQIAIVAENISSVGNNKFELTNITSKRGQTATFDVELIKNKFSAVSGVVRFDWHFSETMPTGTSFGPRTYIVNFNDYEVIAKRATVNDDWMIEPATLVLPTFGWVGNEQPHTLILDENTPEGALEARVTGIKAEIGEGRTEIVKWMGIEPGLFDSMTLQCSMVINWHTAVGIPVEFEVDAVVGSDAEDDPSTGKLSYFYNHLGAAYSRLEDKNEYTVKYITSGGYPLFGVDNDLVTTIMTLADTRGDVLAIVDHVDMPNAPHGKAAEGSIYKQVMQANLGAKTGAAASAMFTPWGKYTFATTAIPDEMSIYMPASFGYLLCMAAAIKTSPNWLAMAGVTRGMVPNLVSLHTNSVLSNTIAEDYQPKFGTNDNNLSINAITNIKPYGLCIWGNRTLLPMDPKGAVAHNFLNTRNMMSDIKKVAYDTAKKLMFEQDSTALWLSFKAGITPLLDQLKVGNGISNYKILRSDVKYSNKERVTRGELAAIIRVYPRFAIEYFDIAVAISEEEVSVS